MSVGPRLLLAYPARSAAAPVDPLLIALSGHWKSISLSATVLALPMDQPDEHNSARLVDAAKRSSGSGPLIVGGFSLGARIAALSAPELEHLPVLAFGFPFHVHGDPKRRHGLGALQRTAAPVLVIQGTRDPHGNREAVNGYDLPPNVSVHWIEGARHRLASPGQIEDAARAAMAFVERVRQRRDE